MSLYDSFFSDINKDHVYHLIKDIVYQNNEVNIFLDGEYKQIYEKGLENIFKDNNANSLDEINKIVVNETIKLFSDKLNNNTKKAYDSNIKLDYDNLFTERMKQNDDFKKNSDKKNSDKNIPYKNNITDNESLINLKQNNKVDISVMENTKEQIKPVNMNVIEYINKDKQIKLDSLSFQETNIKDNQIKSKQNNSENEQSEEWRSVHKIVSNKRSHVRSSRYNYVFNLKNNNINISENSQIQKLIIPLEDNYIFNHSILCLSIKELELDISFELDHELDNNQRTYGVYIPIEAHRFNKPDIDSITIKITDITNTEYVNYDIINVTKLEIADDTIILTVNSVKDIMTEDYFKVLNLSTNIMELRYLLLEPMKVIKIEKNRLFFKTNYIMNSTIVDDIEMKLMNVSNQNIIFFK